MGQGEGVVGSGLGKGQATLHLLGEADGAEEGDETGQPAEGGDGLGGFVQNQLGIAKEGGDFGGVVLCGVGPGCLSINPHAHNLFHMATLFPFRSSGLAGPNYLLTSLALTAH